jgi:hypothetical protein
MQPAKVIHCPDCGEEGISRRQFMRNAAGAVALTAAAVIMPESAMAQRRGPLKPGSAESLVKTLYGTLTPKQNEVTVLAWDNPRRKMISANWAIVEQTIGDTFTADQQAMIRGILKDVTNEEWLPKFLKQMEQDGGGLQNYHVAIFGDPSAGKSELVLTGRHATIRAGGDPAGNLPFGGPIFYGHAQKDTEDPTHPGNVFWYQAKRANEVFQMLDGKQRAIALVESAPNESAISFRKKQEEQPGIPIKDLTRDQREHVRKVMADVLAPYRKSDVDEVLTGLEKNGGLNQMSLAFYKQDDLGTDGVWDIWRLEGPAFVWHFRGAPHVHTWVNVGPPNPARL